MFKKKETNLKSANKDIQARFVKKDGVATEKLQNCSSSPLILGMGMREVTDRKEEEWVYETVLHPNVKHGAQVSNKKCIPHVSRTSIVLMVLLILMLMAFALIIILSVKEIISTETKELRKKQYSLVNTISTKIQSLNSKVNTRLKEQSNQIQSLNSKLYYLIYNRTDANLYKAFKKCSWQVGEGTRYSSYDQDVFIESSVNMNECIKLCVKKSLGYNGAIYRIRNKRCCCLSNMNGRDSDVEYVSCYIR